MPSCTVFLTLSLFLQLVIALKREAKAYLPNSPPESAWSTLSTSLTNPLITTTLPFAPCHAPNPDQPTCIAAARTSTYDHPALIRSDWWTGWTCPTTYSPITNCTLGAYPSRVVRATSEADIIAALRFATKWRVRIAIKNTGHDFLGRNIGYESLSIWTHHLRGISFSANWTPPSAPPDWPPESVVHVSAGEPWRAVSRAAYAAGKLVVGGANPDVGAAGGWILGGGHSPLSTAFGLGVDQVRAMRVVLPNGTAVTASPFSCPDVFWALRGGGGGTFGVLTQVTYRTHDPGSLHAVRLVATPGEGDFVAAMAWVLGLAGEWAEKGVGGYPILHAGRYEGVFIAPGVERGVLDSLFAEVVAGLRERGVLASVTPFDSGIVSWMLGNSAIPHAGTGLKTGTGVMGSRLLSREALADEERVAEVLRRAFEGGYIVEPFVVAGGAVGKTGAEEMGINPDWRGAVMHLTLLDGGSDAYNQTGKVVEAYARMQDDMVPLLERLGGNKGAYVNEASYREPDWQETFWGANYPRLLEIKRALDPNNTLWCYPCVGSEALVLEPDGKLYYPEEREG
ncbi:FAD-binding domain-containing protein [Trichodelitschia bisporula]|uniref:FAD-binding domain-containing protein n=1 Tax=Trichodelitschia bisporula TaxID=703511 RepID=A0A6G1I1E3_9PEZI|nr:FAD-binding domain-containing protein [Trichodelitschia bisporula]